MSNPFVLAPLAGVTDMPFRKLCHEQGAALVYSEMVSAKALHFGDKKSFDLLRSDPAEGALAFQLFGSEPNIMADAVRLIDGMPHVSVDINMGCPVPKIVRNGEGSALMRSPELAGRIVEAMVSATKKPVTVKMRAGWDADSVNAVEFAKVIESAGAAGIAVHARTREQYYSGRAEWSIIADVGNAVGIPVTGSGDVFTARDAMNMLDETGCDAVMIARGALGNPWIFRDALMLYGGASDEDVRAAAPSLADKGDMFVRQLKDTAAHKSEKMAVFEMRKHAGWYFKGVPHIAQFRAAVNKITAIGELEREVMRFCGLENSSGGDNEL